MRSSAGSSGMTEKLRERTSFVSWIQSVSGKKISLMEPDEMSIEIDDIAHALGMLCRFNGHGTKFYSVAEHSVHVSHEVDSSLAMVGLLHDASEAYLGDVPTPLKRRLKGFDLFESRMLDVIAARFLLERDAFEHPELKRADVQLLVDEKAALMVEAPEPWPAQAPEVKDHRRIKAWGPIQAKFEFLRRFKELTMAGT